jgi:hypothetical protein
MSTDFEKYQKISTRSPVMSWLHQISAKRCAVGMLQRSVIANTSTAKGSVVVQ